VPLQSIGRRSSGFVGFGGHVSRERERVATSETARRRVVLTWGWVAWGLEYRLVHDQSQGHSSKGPCVPRRRPQAR
jgi:hypothetical protein